MNRRILITGGSRGIGAGIADAAARRGWTNLLVGRTEPAMQSLIDKWKQAGFSQEHRHIALDLCAPDAMQRLTCWLDEVGYPDVVVHNAAVGFFGPFSQTTLEGHANTVALGVKVTVDVTYALLPHLAKTAGSYMVYIGSTSGRKPVPYMSVYSSTKAFVHNFAFALREELRGSPPKILLVVPGAVQTDFPRLAGLPPSFTAKGRTPADVGEAIVQAIERGKDAVLSIGSFMERHGGLIQRMLPPAFWARKMGRSYARMLRLDE